MNLYSSRYSICSTVQYKILINTIEDYLFFLCQINSTTQKFSKAFEASFSYEIAAFLFIFHSSSKQLSSYFAVSFKVVTLGSSCTPVTNVQVCVDRNSKCTNDKCTCNAGYYDDNGENANGTCQASM